MKKFSIFVCSLLIFICSLVLGNSSVEALDGTNKLNYSYYRPLLLSEKTEKTYTWEGELCGQTEYLFSFSKTMSEDVKYLCEIKEDNSSYSGTKKVIIELVNLETECNVDVFYKERDNSYNSLDVINLNNTSKEIDLMYNYGTDYKFVFNCRGYEKLTYIDNLKINELNLGSEVRRKITLEPSVLLQEDLDVQTIGEKIMNDNTVLSNTLDYSKPSPYIAAYRSVSTNTTLSKGSKKYYFGTNYTFNEATGRYSLSGTFVNSTVNSSSVNYYTILSSSKSETSYTLYKINSINDDSYNVTKYTREISSYDSGLYKLTNSIGTSYFYRGDVSNNYVRFAGYMWRIIRINENGTVRMILDGDIGGSSWNDNATEAHYTAYDYGKVFYSPLISDGFKENYDIETANKNYTEEICYSDSFKYNRSTNRYQLGGNIFCEAISEGMSKDDFDAKFANMYTLNATSETATSSKMQKIKSNGYYSYEYYYYEYDTESSASHYTKFSKTSCYGSSYVIENGKYKLSGYVECGVSVTPSNYNTTYSYTLMKNSADSTSDTMYKLIESKGSSKFYYRTYNKADTFFSNTSKTKSNVKKLLDNWYTNNLYKKYDKFISESTFCNDTSIPDGYEDYYSATKRLKSTNPSPTFECNGAFKYGGKYNLKIGLITADEMVFAGAIYDKINNKYYLAYKKPFWTMTPYSLPINSSPPTPASMFTSTLISFGNTYDMTVDFNGLGTDGVSTYSSEPNLFYPELYTGDTTMVIRPVINVASSNLVYKNNNGTKGNPYEIITDEEVLNFYNYQIPGI